MYVAFIHSHSLVYMLYETRLVCLCIEKEYLIYARAHEIIEDILKKKGV